MWAYNEMVGLMGIIDAYKNGCRNSYEVAEYLEVTEEFLNDALDAYKSKYRVCTIVDNYAIYFIPALLVLERKQKGMVLMNTSSFIEYLTERFKIEQKKRDRSGIYGFIQRLMAYNSNKIEGSTLTEEQTASLFDTGTLPKSDDYYRAKDVEEMNKLFTWYESQAISLETLAEFHARYESIHPFQDGNGRTGRMILFRECLCNNIAPFIIQDANCPEYLDALKAYHNTGSVAELAALFKKEQDYYWNECQYFFAE